MVASVKQYEEMTSTLPLRIQVKMIKHTWIFFFFYIVFHVRNKFDAAVYIIQKKNMLDIIYTQKHYGNNYYLKMHINKLH